ncbi:type I restriction-modification system, DNA-methyltransferase subunit M [[Mycoplasma] phocae]|uniref:site-specific DNA-methyltransferase (adenine-specific) n=1 Tax=[Mycoplasma] phocae TaxID=142651 RepID=A0A2Z5IQ73_9BACT|nr:type I restriction-modification system subunit M [[Mycoplasma] phocae]AXE60875.1 type I restriction-modification system, DNA-methyltransferase subunit M [[Mycoplasma] phocae]
MNKKELAQEIWNAANEMRSKIENNDYKDLITGLVFYKYLSQKEINYIKETEDLQSEEEIKSWLNDDDCQKSFIEQEGYFIKYDDLFSKWSDKSKNIEISQIIQAIRDFENSIPEKFKHIYNEIFKDLQIVINDKIRGSTLKEKASFIEKVIEIVNKIPIDKQDGYDILGFIYEYLIGMFAADAGKKGGEFYTPHEVSELMSEIVAYHLKDDKSIKIYDPTSGSGGLLINIGKAAAKYIKNINEISYYAQDLNSNAYNLTKMNLIIRGIKPQNISVRNADTLENDWPIDNGDPLRLDVVVSNPPYSLNWKPEGHDNDSRYKEYGLAPKSKADYAFLLHDLYHLKPNGIMAIVLPNGVLFRGNSEAIIRRKLVEKLKIDTIIGLPSNIFFGTGIPTIIMILKNNRQDKDILFVDASKCYTKDGNKNKLREQDIKKIFDAVINRQNIEKFSKKVSLDEIEKNDFNLNISRYVDSSEDPENWDINALMNGGIPEYEINNLNLYWNLFPNLEKKLFKKITNNKYECLSKSIYDDVKNDEEIINFINDYKNKFNLIKTNLEINVIDKFFANNFSIDMHGEFEKISNQIFEQFENISIVDKYNAYQILYNNWNKILLDMDLISKDISSIIEIDLETNQKNKKGISNYKYSIIPAQIIKNRFFSKELQDIERDNETLEDNQQKIQEIIESLDEEQISSLEEIAGGEFINDKSNSFKKDAFKKLIKNLNKIDDQELQKTLKNTNNLLDQNIKLNDNIKKLSASLENECVKKLKSLNQQEIKELLSIKWISPIIDEIIDLVNSEIDNLINKIEYILEKYEMSYAEIEQKIHENEISLAKMLDELEGPESDILGLQELKKILGGE